MFFPGSFCTIVLEQRNNDNEQCDCPPRLLLGYIIGTLSSTFSQGHPHTQPFTGARLLYECQTFVVRCSCCDRPGEKYGQSNLVLWNNTQDQQKGHATRHDDRLQQGPIILPRVKDAHSKSRLITSIKL